MGNTLGMEPGQPLVGTGFVVDEKHVAEVMEKEMLEFKRLSEQRVPYTSKLDDFQLHNTLGEGAYGRVLLVKEKAKGNSVSALKIMEKEKIVRGKQVSHVLQEAKLMRSVKFPFLVNLVSRFQDNCNLYMQMEFVPGGELLSLMGKVGNIPEEKCKIYVLEVTAAFEYLHRLNIVYRDLKPENVLIGLNGHLKITDFGFAKEVTDRTYTTCGTPEYLSPEIVKQGGHGLATDWWMLGIFTYEMLCGFSPFVNDDIVKMYNNIEQVHYEFHQEHSKTARNFIENLLQKDLTKRYGNLSNGVWDIVHHPFFTGISCTKLLNMQVNAPYAMKISSADDTSCFDEYDEMPIATAACDMHKEVFADF
eukprot:Nk52_evm27s147 gene=Nk52_evmTU27s147